MIRRLPTTIAAVAVAAGLASAPALAHAPVERVHLRPVAGSQVSGSATYQAKGNGTQVSVTVRGLSPRAPFRTQLHAGTCEQPGASAALIATGRADGRGTGRAAAKVTFRGAPVPISAVADGDHLVAVVSGGRVVACAVLPGMS